MNCRHCGSALRQRFVDLGTAPPSNAFLTREALARPEPRYPLRVDVCTQCWLVQTDAEAYPATLFDADYAYFSSYSTSWLRHAENYVAMMVERFALGEASLVVEIAANDGYLLQYVKARGIPALGVEPTAGTAAAARAKGVDIVEAFFGARLAKDLRGQGRSADLIVANNVLAHVPDIDDFVAGFPILLGSRGVATFEFPHLMQLVRHNQFDTIYHEHFSYLSFTAVMGIFNANGLAVFDVEELATHGGSLRVYAQRKDSGEHPVAASVGAMMAREDADGMRTAAYYQGFQPRAEKARDDFVAFLTRARAEGKSVAAYGAAAKGNTLLNFAGVGAELVPFVADRNPAKQGKYLPGSHIPVVADATIAAEKPDYIVILPWNLADEIMAQLDYARAWGAKFVTAIPKLDVR